MGVAELNLSELKGLCWMRERRVDRLFLPNLRKVPLGFLWWPTDPETAGLHRFSKVIVKQA